MGNLGDGLVFRVSELKTMPSSFARCTSDACYMAISHKSNNGMTALMDNHGRIASNVQTVIMARSRLR